MSVDATTIRADLIETRDRLSQRDATITAGAEAGISKTELAALSGLSRQHIYDVLERHEKAKKKAEASEVAKVEALWKLGLVVEDRWGLRWRADLIASPRLHGDDTKRWVCRSVGLRVSLSHGQMADRGELKTIRLDKVFAGPLGSPEQKAAVAERKAGEAEDAAVTVTPQEDPEP